MMIVGAVVGLLIGILFIWAYWKGFKATSGVAQWVLLAAAVLGVIGIVVAAPKAIEKAKE